MNTRKILACLCGALLVSISPGAGSAERFDWRTDCVGRFSLELPGEVLVAMRSDNDLVGPDLSPQYRFAGFPDETAPAWQSLQSVGNLAIVSGPQADTAGFAHYRQWMDKRFESKKRELIARHRTEEADEFQPGQTSFPNVHVWHDGLLEFLLFWRNNRLFSTQNYGGKYNTEIRHLSEHLRSRELFEVPQEPGLCLHYGFLPDDGTLKRRIAVTYRLKDHPELEIYFRDSSASLNPYPKREGTVSDDVKNFWNRDRRTFGKSELRLISPHVPGMMMFPNVKIAGFTGKRSLVKITREDDEGREHVDYGYAAIVRGDDTAKDDQPDLMLYVISDYRRAKGTPLTKDQIEEIADHIAASIKRR